MIEEDLDLLGGEAAFVEAQVIDAADEGLVTRATHARSPCRPGCMFAPVPLLMSPRDLA